jgi:Protein of unknown function (DUF3275)
MITIHGQLAIKTIHGRNGPFNVGRLATAIGEFVIKNAELDQYDEGKYDGEFVIAEILPSMYTTSARMVIELRAHLGGMTLSDIDRLSRDDSHRLTPQEIDPIDEERQTPSPATPVPTQTEPAAPASRDPLIDTTPFGAPAPTKSAPQIEPGVQDDTTLFGPLWPLGSVVKLDPTVHRRTLRQQCARLDALGYTFAPLTQDWHLNVS